MNAPDPTSREAIDGEHLQLLAIFHYVIGGVYLFFSCFGFIYVALGLVMVTHPEFLEHANDPHQGPPAWVGFFLAAVGACFVLLGWTFGGLTLYSGRCIRKRQRRTFSQVMAAINCLWIPFGTILGAFTLVVLSRPSVIKTYEARSQ
jgi:hypothetical protein